MKDGHVQLTLSRCICAFLIMTFFTPYICTDQEETLRQAKDLVYEAMKMRTGNWKTWDRNRFEIVGGGILEKKMLEQGGMIAEEALEGLQYESREMQCCDQLTIESWSGVKESHPYVLGDYKKIGSCKGKSFYQHKNNTDIFLYHSCGAWYLGLEISQCGGWLVSKDVSNAICAVQSREWKYFDQGVLKEDDTFQILERCTFQGDFFPVPPTKPPVTTLWAPSAPLKPLGYPQYHYPSLNRPTPTPATLSSVKHEHYHYHYENWDGGNGVTGKSPPQSTSAYVYSRPLEVTSNPSSSYKNQYRGDPYRKRADDDQPYFPVDNKKSIVENGTLNNDKNSRKIQ